ncbi:MAG: sigma-54-dependent Fis family transcriptional regulator [Deltaproteobacteria bacterium]|nr:sigma-54-dependent Fis family transcriptional regulator [Deltaproteobacteria bacterium]
MTTTKEATVLLIDDDAAFRAVYAGLLRGQGYSVDQADDRASATAAVAKRTYAVVLLDLMLPPDGTTQGGIAQLKAVLSQRPESKVIVVSGAGDTHVMLQAIKDGAYDFITKPADPDVLLTVVQRAQQRFLLEQQLAALRQSLVEARPSDAIIGESPKFQAALELASRVAPTTLPVLILGENGTGKEMLARFIHQKSTRGAAPFLAVNCGAIPESLFESTLFGHKRGSFTGAMKDHAGVFGQADGGTLFLDEIGDLPLPMQVKLLRALESGEIFPVGADRPRTVDVRILAATNQDLTGLQRTGQFREDLYWRIKGAEVVLPSLRERTSDITLLAVFFLNQSTALTVNGRPRTLSPSATEALLRHPWPGNLRELRHEMQRASVLVGEQQVIEASDLSCGQTLSLTRETESAPTGTLLEQIEALERREIERALTTHHGNRTHAAEALGLSRQGLLKKMERYGFS